MCDMGTSVRFGALNYSCTTKRKELSRSTSSTLRSLRLLCLTVLTFWLMFQIAGCRDYVVSPGLGGSNSQQMVERPDTVYVPCDWAMGKEEIC